MHLSFTMLFCVKIKEKKLNGALKLDKNGGGGRGRKVKNKKTSLTFIVDDNSRQTKMEEQSILFSFFSCWG